MILPWQYPDSTSRGASMSDGATMSPDGQRTCQSITCKTTMVTDATVDEVLNYYALKLKPTKDETTDTFPFATAGRSVVVSDDSADRPFAMHTVLVNTSRSSTTLIITRGKDEAQTHIAWKHYRRLTNDE